jgi:hypothetical protein
MVKCFGEVNNIRIYKMGRFYFLVEKRDRLIFVNRVTRYNSYSKPDICVKLRSFPPYAAAYAGRQIPSTSSAIG